MKIKLWCVSVALLTIVSEQLFANELELIGTFPLVIETESTQSKLLKTKELREIKLLKIKLSPKAKQILAQKVKSVTYLKNKSPAAKIQFPSSIQLGMNGVPVLDQGKHGSCVTFAATAAIDAVIGKEDYVSQLCQLQLGNYLKEYAYSYSSWEGSSARDVLSQIELFGIINTYQQKEIGCGGLTEYPLNDSTPVSSIKMEDFRQLSESLDDYNITWTPILDSVVGNFYSFDSDNILVEIKQSLIKGDRVVFGSFLPTSHQGIAGAAGTQNKKYDTWVITQDIIEEIYKSDILPGHDMVITGYDDQAIATDDQGNYHNGLLTLRNSWGKGMGDEGNFYMSYDYFKLLVNEAFRIRKVE